MQITVIRVNNPKNRILFYANMLRLEIIYNQSAGNAGTQHNQGLVARHLLSPDDAIPGIHGEQGSRHKEIRTDQCAIYFHSFNFTELHHIIVIKHQQAVRHIHEFMPAVQHIALELIRKSVVIKELEGFVFAKHRGVMQVEDLLRIARRARQQQYEQKESHLTSNSGP